MNRRFVKNAKKEMKKFWSFSFFAALLLVAGAVLQLNSFIHESSLLSDSKKQIAALSAENDQCEVRLSQSNSLDDFNRYAAAQAGNYEKVDVANVRYVHALDGQLAKR